VIKTVTFFTSHSRWHKTSSTFEIDLQRKQDIENKCWPDWLVIKWFHTKNSISVSNAIHWLEYLRCTTWHNQSACRQPTSDYDTQISNKNKLVRQTTQEELTHTHSVRTATSWQCLMSTVSYSQWSCFSKTVTQSFKINIFRLILYSINHHVRQL